MRKHFLFIFCLSWQVAALAQTNGKISGSIKTQEGSPIEGITVLLGQGGYTAVSDASGFYTLKNLPLDSHTILIRGLGFEDEKREVLLTPELPASVVNFTLSATTTALQEVEVLGRNEVSYKSDYSFIGTKTASLVIDVPQTISSVTKELIEDQQAFTLNAGFAACSSGAFVHSNLPSRPHLMLWHYAPVGSCS